MENLSFKDILHRDIKQVFLNPVEFGEEHLVNGKTMTVVLDDLENIEREKKTNSNSEGLFVRQIFLYVSADDFGGPLPAQGAVLTLDKKKYLVVDATDESGMYGITLEANKSSR